MYFQTSMCTRSKLDRANDRLDETTTPRLHKDERVSSQQLIIFHRGPCGAWLLADISYGPGWVANGADIVLRKTISIDHIVEERALTFC